MSLDMIGSYVFEVCTASFFIFVTLVSMYGIFSFLLMPLAQKKEVMRRLWKIATQAL